MSSEEHKKLIEAIESVGKKFWQTNREVRDKIENGDKNQTTALESQTKAIEEQTKAIRAQTTSNEKVSRNAMILTVALVIATIVIAIKT